MTNIQRQRELQERIADDERHAATAHKAAAYDDLLTRAEAAEAERDELHERYGNLNAAYVDLVIKNTEHGNRMYAAERRVAELESQLAAQQWRPGNENPPAPDWYQVGDIGVGVYDLWYSGEAWYRSSFQGATYRTPPMSAPDYWRPIPPLPPAPQETE